MCAIARLMRLSTSRIGSKYSKHLCLAHERGKELGADMPRQGSHCIRFTDSQRTIVYAPSKALNCLACC
jgi:hypothetical protein